MWGNGAKTVMDLKHQVIQILMSIVIRLDGGSDPTPGKNSGEPTYHGLDKHLTILVYYIILGSGSQDLTVIQIL